MDDKCELLIGATKQAVNNVFENMLSKSVAFIDVVPAIEVPQKPDFLVGLIGFDGDFRGSIGVVFTTSLSKVFVAAMLGIEEPAQSDITDVVGEMANMVAGGVKCAVEKRLPNLSITCPTVIHGTMDFPATPNQQVVTLKFKSDEDFFAVLVLSQK